MRFSKGFVVVALVAMLSVAVSGCATLQDDAVEIGYVNWACATASTYLAKNIIETELGFDVIATDLQAGMMWQSLSEGDIDAIVCAWLPGTHKEYMDQFGDDVVDLGPNYEGAKIGLVVPSYVDIDSIEELNDNIDAFAGRIVGIDAGAGVMSATNSAIDAYELELELLESGDAAMTIELRNAIRNEEWIVVTGWTPHWKFAEWDLKFLEDPQEIFGGDETINTVTSTTFAVDNPEVQAFLDNYFLTAEQLGSLIGLMEEHDDRDEAAQAWIDENRAAVNAWLGN